MVLWCGRSGAACPVVMVARWRPTPRLADVTLALEEQELADSARLRLAAGRGLSSRA